LKAVAIRNNKFIIYLLLFAASFNTVLRPSIESDITLFRLMSPIILLNVLLNRSKDSFGSRIAILMGITLYGMVVGILSRFAQMDVLFLAHYLLLAVFVMFVLDIAKKRDNIVYNFLRFAFFLSFVLGCLEILTSWHLPNTNYRPHEIVSFFWNGNESSAFVASTSVVMYLKNKRKVFSWLYLCMGFTFSYFNSSRLTMAALALLFIYLVIKKLTVYLPVILSIFTRNFLIITFFGILWVIKGDTITIYALLLGKNILTGNVFYNVGSIFNRINAVTLGLHELFSSYGFGIGPGNSRIFMTEIIVPGTERFTAYSMHNPVLQFFVEYGFLAILMLAWALKNVKKYLYLDSPRSILILVLIVLLISSITSGFHSNFALVMSLVYLVKTGMKIEF